MASNQQAAVAAVPSRRRVLVILAIAVALADQVLLGILPFFALFEADSSSPPSHFAATAYEGATFVLAPLVLLGRRAGWVNVEPLMMVLSGVLWGIGFYAVAASRAPRRRPAPGDGKIQLSE